MVYKEASDMLDTLQQHEEYTEYLNLHISNVMKAYEWLKEHVPDLLDPSNYVSEGRYYGELDEIIKIHDASKYLSIPDVDNYYELKCEFDAYSHYFYGKTKTEDTQINFDYAWLSHIHQNPHHWQHWVLEDEGNVRALDMPYVFIIEMFCDHFSFSFKKQNLKEIFSWYEDHKDKMILSDKTRAAYERILYRVKHIIDKEQL